LADELMLGTSSTEARMRYIREHTRELRGKNLACFCPLPAPGEPDLCHGFILIGAANA